MQKYIKLTMKSSVSALASVLICCTILQYNNNFCQTLREA